MGAAMRFLLLLAIAVAALQLAMATPESDDVERNVFRMINQVKQDLHRAMPDMPPAPAAATPRPALKMRPMVLLRRYPSRVARRMQFRRMRMMRHRMMMRMKRHRMKMHRRLRRMRRWRPWMHHKGKRKGKHFMRWRWHKHKGRHAAKHLFKRLTPTHKRMRLHMKFRMPKIRMPKVHLPKLKTGHFGIKKAKAAFAKSMKSLKSFTHKLEADAKKQMLKAKHYMKKANKKPQHAAAFTKLRAAIRINPLLTAPATKKKNKKAWKNFRPLPIISAKAPMKKYCLHTEDAADNKCYEGCARRAFKAKGLSVAGACPSKYSVQDTQKRVKACSDGVTNLKYCTGSLYPVNIRERTMGMGAVKKMILGGDSSTWTPKKMKPVYSAAWTQYCRKQASPEACASTHKCHFCPKMKICHPSWAVVKANKAKTENHKAVTTTEIIQASQQGEKQPDARRGEMMVSSGVLVGCITLLVVLGMIWRKQRRRQRDLEAVYVQAMSTPLPPQV